MQPARILRQIVDTPTLDSRSNNINPNDSKPNKIKPIDI